MADAAKSYLYENKIPQLFESLIAGLMYHKPGDHVTFLQHCLARARENGRPQSRQLFSSTKPLPPIPDEDPHPKSDSTPLQPITETTIKTQSDGRQELSPKPIIFVLGGPGSGKGTQCSRIVEDFWFTHLSAGDLLRQEVVKGTPQGQQLQEIMKQGKLVPAEVTIGLLKSAMLSTPDAVGFLIDGFPRELQQGKLFEEQVCECSLVMVFECGEGVMVERLLQRGLTGGQVDDNEETIRKRLHTFQEATLPVIQHYQARDKVRKINSDRSVEEVYVDVSELFKEITSTMATTQTKDNHNR